MIEDAFLTGCGFLRGEHIFYRAMHRYGMLCKSRCLRPPGCLARHVIDLALSGRLGYLGGDVTQGGGCALPWAVMRSPFRAKIPAYRLLEKAPVTALRSVPAAVGLKPLPSRLCFEVKSEKLSQVAG